MTDIVKNRYDFILFFDVQDGNPNGDPDAGNLPRIDAETGKGLVTDVCLKRKVRNYVQLKQKNEIGYDIFIKEKAILNNSIAEARGSDRVQAIENVAEQTATAREIMCEKFFDVRTFGAVMSTGENAGQVRGPVQMTFARSVDPIVALEHSITRMAVATEAEAENQGGENRTMGRKYTVPYGLYRAHGFISANLAADTKFSEKDLELFWESLENMFDHDHSAARGLMAVRKIIIFKHDSALGNKPAHKLFEMVPNPELKNSEIPPRAFSDYQGIITPAEDQLPDNITVKVLE
ncbi:MAG: type I-C CRISPR-associated protein Cas7/Csd2 [Desulfobacter postgatei]|uniref:Type I-C CRISPR-associated protein Cas7/Csd2 n=1 Tax=Desulfobacter postgatei TaxID=2293 RepID=A0A2G6MS08_9BACT|nr:MAG: type I-C CRISPR-associated protein Cas7/Csd2 [Desulfobacter postgatei]